MAEFTFDLQTIYKSCDLLCYTETKGGITMKKKSGFPGIFAGIVIAAVFFIGIGLFR